MIKAIDTVYNGYKFRSRLEARWAVFFDAVGIKYEYEKEGYDLGEDGRYLPDFFLPEIDGGVWIEVKPNIKNEGCPTKKMISLVKHTKKRGMIVKGEPLESLNEITSQCNPPGWDDGSAYWMCFPPERDDNGELYVGQDGPYVFCVCPWCGKIGIEFDGRGARVCGFKNHGLTRDEASESLSAMGLYAHEDKGYTSNHDKITSAMVTARQFRFENHDNPPR